jgi:hypothetical protein
MEQEIHLNNIQRLGSTPKENNSSPLQRSIG